MITATIVTVFPQQHCPFSHLLVTVQYTPPSPCLLRHSRSVYHLQYHWQTYTRSLYKILIPCTLFIIMYSTVHVVIIPYPALTMSSSFSEYYSSYLPLYLLFPLMITIATSPLYGSCSHSYMYSYISHRSLIISINKRVRLTRWCRSVVWSPAGEAVGGRWPPTLPQYCVFILHCRAKVVGGRL